MSEPQPDPEHCGHGLEADACQLCRRGLPSCPVEEEGERDRSAAAAALEGTYGWPYEHCLKVATALLDMGGGRVANAVAWVLAVVSREPRRYAPGRFGRPYAVVDSGTPPVGG